jgi:hypothetical protein
MRRGKSSRLGKRLSRRLFVHMSKSLKFLKAARDRLYSRIACEISVQADRLGRQLSIPQWLLFHKVTSITLALALPASLIVATLLFLVGNPFVSFVLSLPASGVSGEILYVVLSVLAATGMVLILYGEGAVWLIHKAIRYAKRSTTKRLSVSEFVKHNGDRQFVLYLRSFFDEDGDDSSSPDERTVIREIRAALPREINIALIGNPVHALPFDGYVNVYLGDDWKAAVSILSREAILVIIRPGGTPGVCWELRQVLKLCPHSRICLALPEHRTGRKVRLSLRRNSGSWVWSTIAGERKLLEELSARIQRLDSVSRLLHDGALVVKGVRWNSDLFSGIDDHYGLVFSNLDCNVTGHTTSLITLFPHMETFLQEFRLREVAVSRIHAVLFYGVVVVFLLFAVYDTMSRGVYSTLQRTMAQQLSFFSDGRVICVLSVLAVSISVIAIRERWCVAHRKSSNAKLRIREELVRRSIPF